MAQHTVPVDGQNDLTAQEGALNMAQDMGAALVTKYAKQAGGAAAAATVNEAILQGVSAGTEIHSLYLSSADTTADPAKVVCRKPGQPQVFHGIAYVSGVEKLVVGFRQL